MLPTFLVVLAYVIGSLPFAYLLARQWAGIDVRTVGSGNVGATNVLRHAPGGIALAVLALDVGKGLATVWIGRRAGLSEGTLALMAIAAITGHIYPVWLRFHGGKGVATTAGAFAVLAPRATLVATIVFALLVWASRFVSLGSLAGALTLVAAGYGFRASRAVIAASIAAAALIAWRHRENVARLLAGREHRLGAESNAAGAARETVVRSD